MRCFTHPIAKHLTNTLEFRNSFHANWDSLFTHTFTFFKMAWSISKLLTFILPHLCSLIKNDADEKITETADESNKYDYQANRNFIIGSLTINLPKILCNVFKLSKIENIYIEATRCKSQIIPRRSFPRRKNKMSCRKHYGNRKVTR